MELFHFCFFIPVFLQDTSLQALRRGVVAHLGYDPSKDRTYTREEAIDRYEENHLVI